MPTANSHQLNCTFKNVPIKVALEKLGTMHCHESNAEYFKIDCCSSAFDIAKKISAMIGIVTFYMRQLNLELTLLKSIHYLLTGVAAEIRTMSVSK